MATTASATLPMSSVGGDWRTTDVARWSKSDVQDFLATVLPGHGCQVRFGHTTGRVLNTLNKEDLRRHAKDEEATNVIWAELRRLKEASREREEIAAHGDEAYTIFIRTPADVSVEIAVQPKVTVGELKGRIARVEGTPVEVQRLMWNGVPMLDTRTLASYNVVHNSVLLLVPRLASNAQRYAPPPAARSSHVAGSGIPRPRVPVVCTDIARPFPMSIEFPSIPEYQGFMLALQRQTGRSDPMSLGEDGDVNAPFIEILPADNARAPVQTRIVFDPDAEVLLIDTVGDILMEFTRYKVLLQLRDEQKLAYLCTGDVSARA